MDLFKLSSSTFLPTTLIENYESMIWTERYATPGEFELVTSQVDEAMVTLPEDSFIGVRGSQTMMQVETHSIDEDDDGSGKITIKGRAVEKVFEGRVLTGVYQTPWAMQQNYTVQDALMVLLWNSIVNPTTFEVLRPSYPRDFHENIPNAAIADRVTIISAATGDVKDLLTSQEWWLEPGDLHAQMTDLINLGELGIRVIRPLSSLDAHNLVSVDSDGVITKTTTSANDKLVFEIYNGRNRSMHPSTVDPLSPVVFRQDQGDFDSPKALFSNQNYKNWAHIESSIGNYDVYDGMPVGAPEPTGLNLRSIFVDGGTIDDSIDYMDFVAALKQKAYAELKKYNKSILLDGAVSATSSTYQFNRDYFLGDIVTAVGRYGIVQDMQVTEYIMADDAQGERGYPTLVVQT